MAITYTWGINKLDVRPSHNGRSNVVETVHWKCDGIDEQGRTAQCIGSVLLDINKPGPFIPYENLNKGTTIAWVQAGLGQAMVTTIQNDIATKIANQISPSLVTLDPPWDATIAN